MDAFEQLVSEILWMEGYWVRTSAKVDLTKEEKRQIGRPSSPRWELDIVAYSGRDNLLKVIECKSYLDSRGVLLACRCANRPNSTNFVLVGSRVRPNLPNLLRRASCTRRASERYWKQITKSSM